MLQPTRSAPPIRRQGGAGPAAERGRMAKRNWLLSLVLITGLQGVCGADTHTDQRFGAVAQRFLQRYLELNPELATTLGEHRYDGRWTDMSEPGLAANLQFQQVMLQELAQIPRDRLGAENQVDYDMLQHHLRSQSWQLAELKEYQWNPLLYNAGPALFSLLARDYAPLPERLDRLAERLEGLPTLLQQARAQLARPPALHTSTAISQNTGNINFLRNDLEPFLAQVPEKRARVEKARQTAIVALESYGAWLAGDLQARSDGEFRLGPQRYERKLFFTLESSLSADEIRTRAEHDLRKTQQEMAQLARPLYRELLGKDPAGVDDRAVCKAVLDKLAERRPDNATIVPKARQSLQRTTAFVAEKQLVSLPSEECKIIEMPEFNRGVAVAYCDSPGPLEKGGETYYAIAPTPEDWTPERVTSFYREYNDFMLEDLTVHEAMPGHYLQLMHANRFKAPTQVRAVLQSGTFVEGWATYAEQLMALHGYGGPEVHMQQLKMRLRLILNALLDQKVHAGKLQEKEAVAWLMREGFQEEGEATGKWRRACLTSGQLSTYYVGNAEVNDLVEAYRRSQPDASSRQMHDRILSFGSPAPRYLFRLLKLEL
jgi:uncharacterized protein (DUF885 family)